MLYRIFDLLGIIKWTQLSTGEFIVDPLYEAEFVATMSAG